MVLAAIAESNNVPTRDAQVLAREILLRYPRERAEQLVAGARSEPRPAPIPLSTLIADIDPGNPLVTEEQFGPALPIIRWSDLDEVIDQANSVEVGLGASVWSSDRDRAREVAARIESGTVWINSHGTIHPMVPFGGAKQSGYGLEFGVEGLKALGVPQVING